MFKNSLKTQYTHRERQQPADRKHLGLLEKKKDYKRRANDYNQKKKALKILRQKAMDKNPDEFNYHMINSKIIDGEHTEKPSVKLEKSLGHVLSEEQIALMQTQDRNYILSKRTTERRKLERLQSRLHLISSEGKPQNTHTIFVDNKKEKKKLDIASYLDTHPALLHRTYNRPRLSDLKSGKYSRSFDAEQLTKTKRDTAKMYKELEQRINREEKLAILQRKMEIKSMLKCERNKPEKKVKDETEDSAPVYIWPKERKR